MSNRFLATVLQQVQVSRDRQLREEEIVGRKNKEVANRQKQKWIEIKARKRKERFMERIKDAELRVKIKSYL